MSHNILSSFIGTGQIIAQTSVDKGAATVLLLNRPSDRATKAEADLRKSIPEGSKTNVESIPCDLQDFESVKQAASLIKSKYEAIDVLCNNAGVMALEDVATKDGYDVQMQTNHLSHFLLTKELYPLLKKARDLRGEARVVHHSSARSQASWHSIGSQVFGKEWGKPWWQWFEHVFRWSALATLPSNEIGKCRNDIGIARPVW